MAEPTDRLDGRLAAMNPLPHGVKTIEASLPALDEIRLRARSGARDQARPARRRLTVRPPATRRGLAVFSAVGVMAAGGVAAAATLVSTYTGQNVPASEAPAFGSGQELLVGAAGYCGAVNKLTADVPFPSGYTAWRNWALLGVSSDTGTTLSQFCDRTTPEETNGGAGEQPSLISEGEIKATFASTAFCAWADAWVRAELAADTTAVSAGASQIAAALQWPAMQAFASNATDGSITAGSGDNTPVARLGWVPALQSAVAAGDITQVRQAFNYYADPSDGTGGSSCAIYRPPANSEDGTYVPAPTTTPPTGDGF